MANTYHQLYIHAVFPVKYRKALIHPDWKPELQSVMGTVINDSGCSNIIINGTEDHIHCYFGLKPSVSLSVVIQQMKAKSSKWINESGYLSSRFEWQPGFGAFSYSRSQTNDVYEYIKNQDKFHQRVSFREEYVALLNKFGVEYDERFIFKDPV